MKPRALVVIAAQSLFAMASLLTSDDPVPTHAAPALIHPPAFFTSTPPVGESLSCGRGARMSRINCGPSAVDGNTFTRSAPAVHAVKISVGVNAPGTLIFPYRRV